MPVDCINQAMVTYHVPIAVILSVMKKEKGRNSQAVRNKNGTLDYGVMQVNNIWLPKIGAYGHTKEDLQYNACKNVLVGSWILSQSIAEGKTIGSGIGNYYSHIPTHNRRYREDIYNNYKKISFALHTAFNLQRLLVAIDTWLAQTRESRF